MGDADTTPTLRQRVVRTLAGIAPGWPLRGARAAAEMGHWLEAFDILAGLVRAVPLAAMPEQRRDEVFDAWLLAALELHATSHVPLEQIREAIAATPREDLPARARSVARALPFAAAVLETESPSLMAAYGRTLGLYLEPSPERDYLAGRALGAAARATGDPGLAVEADALLASAERGLTTASADLVRCVRAHTAAAADTTAAQGLLEPVNPWSLATWHRAVYATLMVDGARRMRRVRALDLVPGLVSSHYAAPVTTALLGRIGRLDAEPGAMEADRIEGALDAVAASPERALAAAETCARAHLGALASHDRTFGDPAVAASDAARRYAAAVRAVVAGELEVVVPTATESPHDLGRLALVVASEPIKHAERLPALAAHYVRPLRGGDLMPLAWLVPRLLERGVWDALAVHTRTAARTLAARFIERGPTPRYGFSALAELALVVEAWPLAASAMVRALADTGDDALLAMPGVAQLCRRGPRARAGDVVLRGVRALVEADDLPAARDLLLAWQSAGAKARPLA